MTEPPPRGWLNRTVIGAGLTSLLADLGYELAGALLPGFLIALALPASRVLGWVEGTADLLANTVKLLVGWLGDRLRRKQPLVVAGYALTGAANALYAIAAGWPMVFAAKLTAWAGKGIRSPLRNAILADAVHPADRGKAFGLHRAGDTLGAVLGPLGAYFLLSNWTSTEPADPTAVYRFGFLLALIPGLGAALAFWLLIRERPREPGPSKRFAAAVRDLPPAFKRSLWGIGAFGLGDLSDKLLVLAAVQLLAPGLGLTQAAALGALLLAWRNAVQVVAAVPIGALGDRIGRRGVLTASYWLGAATLAGFAWAGWASTDSRLVLFALLGLAGVYLAAEETLESALVADLVPDANQRGTAYGVLAAVNGVGDFVACALAGELMYGVGLGPAFAVAAACMALGAVLLRRVR